MQSAHHRLPQPIKGKVQSPVTASSRFLSNAFLKNCMLERVIPSSRRALFFILHSQSVRGYIHSVKSIQADPSGWFCSLSLLSTCTVRHTTHASDSDDLSILQTGSKPWEHVSLSSSNSLEEQRLLHTLHSLYYISLLHPACTRL